MMKKGSGMSFILQKHDLGSGAIIVGGANPT